MVRHVARAISGGPLQTRPYAAAMIAAAMVRPALQIAALPVRLVRAAFAGLVRGWRYLTVGMTPDRSG